MGRNKPARGGGTRPKNASTEEGRLGKLPAMRRLLWPTLLLLAALPFLTVAALAVRSTWRTDTWILFKQYPGDPAIGAQGATGAVLNITSVNGHLVFRRCALPPKRSGWGPNSTGYFGWEPGHHSDRHKTLADRQYGLSTMHLEVASHSHFSQIQLKLEEGLDLLGLQTYRVQEYLATAPAHSPPTMDETFAIIPAWWSLPLLTAPPLLTRRAWRRSTRRRLRREGRCVGCGYDLRASPAHCPECGLSQAAA